MTTALVIGSYLSPYVRKVLVCLGIKGVPYEVDPIVPFYGDEEFSRLSPLRRIPVLVDGEVVLSDSSVICEYLEERYPLPALLPSGAPARGRARWLEEFADTRMGEVFIWRFFNQLVIRRFVWGESPDEEMLRRVREVEIPEVLGYLESELPAEGWLFGELSVADVALASFFRNASFARFELDSARWPRVSSFVARAHALPAFTALRPFEELSMRTPIAQHREALRGAGAPISSRTVGTARSRRGVLAI